MKKKLKVFLIWKKVLSKYDPSPFSLTLEVLFRCRGVLIS